MRIDPHTYNSLGTPEGVAERVSEFDRRLRQIEAVKTSIGEFSIGSGHLGPGSVTSGAIGFGAITASSIAAGSITASAIAANAITANAIAADSINAIHIVSGAITSDLIAAGTISSNNIAAGAITTALLASGVVTGEKIVSGAITSDKINVASLSAVSSNMGTLTAGIITGGTIQTSSTGARAALGKNIVTSQGTYTGIVGLDAANAVTFLFDAANGNVELKGQIKAGSSGLGNIAGQIHGTNNVALDTIAGNRLITDSITTRELAAASVTATEIAAVAVTAGKIAAGAVTAVTIAAGAVTADKLTATAIDGKSITGVTITGSVINGGTINGITINGGSVVGANISTSTIFPRIQITSFGLEMPFGDVNGSVATLSAIDWIAADGAVCAGVGAYSSGINNVFTLGAKPTQSRNAQTWLQAGGNFLRVSSDEEAWFFASDFGFRMDGKMKIKHNDVSWNGFQSGLQVEADNGLGHPRIAFHIPNVVRSQLRVINSGVFQFVNDVGDNYVEAYGFFVNPSDESLKEEFSAINYDKILDRVRSMPISNYAWKNSRHASGKKSFGIGPTAQEFRTTWPEFVEDATEPEDPRLANMLGIPVNEALGVCMAAIRALTDKVDQLERKTT